MPRPKLIEKQGMYTMSDLELLLGISRRQIRFRIDQGMLPNPTIVTEHHVKLFSEEWVIDAKEKLDYLAGKVPELKARLDLNERSENS